MLRLTQPYGSSRRLGMGEPEKVEPEETSKEREEREYQERRSKRRLKLKNIRRKVKYIDTESQMNKYAFFYEGQSYTIRNSQA